MTKRVPSTTMLHYLLLLILGLQISKAKSNPMRTKSIAKVTEIAQNNSCYLPWAKRSPPNYGCDCENRVDDVLQCPSHHETRVMACYCVTQSQDMDNTSVVGNCIVTCWDDEYYPLNANKISELENVTCGMVHRTGQLCGQCIDGYAPPAYSYSIECVQCTGDTLLNKIKYIAVAFLPLTAFYIVLISCRISVTAADKNAYIFISQVFAAPSQLRYIYSLGKSHQGYKVLEAAYAIWNLDFFRSFYPLFCFHPNMNNLQARSLDYIVAVYPMLLILVTYIFISIADRFGGVVRLLTPIHKCCVKFRKQIQVQNSLIDAFAAFILLSYIKILNISFDLLVPTKIYFLPDYKLTDKQYLYLDATVEMFSSHHCPYAILAIVMFLIFNILPLVLLGLYPYHYFQLILNRCGLRCQTLHIFMDAYLSCYKSKPYNCRYFAAVYLALRIFNLCIIWLTLNKYYFCFASISMMGIAGLIAAIRPYKQDKYNRIDTLLFLISACTYAFCATATLTQGKIYSTPLTVLVCIPATIVPVYGLGLFLNHVVPTRRIKTFIQKRFKKQKIDETSNLLPHRLLQENR